MHLRKLRQLQQEQQKILAEIRALSAAVASLSAPPSPPPPNTWMPPGHFYSPIVDVAELAHRAEAVFNPERSIGQIDLRAEAQLELLAALSPHAARLDFPEEPTEAGGFYFLNPYFSYGDALVLASFLMHLRPKRLMEIGSGFSSALALAVDAQFLDRNTEFTFIDPFPERLYSLLDPAEQARHRIITTPVQDVPLHLFQELDSGDILFIDSTHVSKAGSDVHYEIFEILPSLKSGVYVHFHDIFYPFEYPPIWFFEENRSWNEIYLLRAYLTNNNDYEIILFNDFLGKKYPEAFENYLPGSTKNPGGSLWLRRR